MLDVLVNANKQTHTSKQVKTAAFQGTSSWLDRGPPHAPLLQKWELCKCFPVRSPRVLLTNTAEGSADVFKSFHVFFGPSEICEIHRAQLNSCRCIQVPSSWIYQLHCTSHTLTAKCSSILKQQLIWLIYGYEKKKRNTLAKPPKPVQQQALLKNQEPTQTHRWKDLPKYKASSWKASPEGCDELVGWVGWLVGWLGWMILIPTRYVMWWFLSFNSILVASWGFTDG